MTALAPALSRFLREHLPRDQRASPHTCDAYAYSFQLLVTFAARQLQKAPSQLEVEDIGVPMILSFLEHIERDRGNSARSRNARLAAIKSFFRFLEYRVPACLDQSLRVRAIPIKKTDQTLVASLTRAEIQALIDAPDPKTIYGARDRAMLHLAFSAGLR
ncbi:tyrosine-type recombinase/integrase, partial [Roseicitreum antarcticum]